MGISSGTFPGGPGICTTSTSMSTTFCMGGLGNWRISAPGTPAHCPGAWGSGRSSSRSRPGTSTGS